MAVLGLATWIIRGTTVGLIAFAQVGHNFRSVVCGKNHFKNAQMTSRGLESWSLGVFVRMCQANLCM